MNAIVPQLPPELSHLAHFYQGNLPNLGNEASAGINTFAHHRISIRGGKWRLVDAQGVETPVQQFHLDVIFVDANPFMSKTYYAGGYDSTTEDKAAPTCWSDNGVGPSDRVSAPVCNTCAACPMNVIGSKITEGNKPTKACSDSKKLAVVLADNPTGPVYELRVPPASLKNMANAFKTYTARGMRIETMVFRLSFEMEAEYPKVIFNVTNYIDAAQAAVVQKLLGSPETAEIVSKTDKPKQGVIAAPAPMAIVAPVHAVQPTTPYAPQIVSQPAPQPVAAAPAAPTFQMPQMAPGGIVGAIPVGVEPEAPKKTKRKAAPEAPTAAMVMPPVATPQAPAVAPVQQFMPPTFPAPQAVQMDVPYAAPAAAAVITQASPTNLELDNILNGLNL